MLTKLKVPILNRENFKLNLILLLILFGGFGNSGNNLLAQEESKAWFYYDRSLPYDSIPPEAYIDALEQQWDKRENDGYILSPSSFVWTSIGPTPVNPGSNSRSGRVVRVKFDAADPDIVYIAGHNGGIWKSINAQDPPADVVFTPITEGLKTQSSGDIAIDPQNHNTLYYGTGGNVLCFPNFNYYGIGVYK